MDSKSKKFPNLNDRVISSVSESYTENKLIPSQNLKQKSTSTSQLENEEFMHTKSYIDYNSTFENPTEKPFEDESDISLNKIKNFSHSSNESDYTNTLVNDGILNDSKLPVTALEMSDKGQHGENSEISNSTLLNQFESQVDCSTNNLTVNNKKCHEKSNSSTTIENYENYEFDSTSTIQASVIHFSASSEKKTKKFVVSTSKTRSNEFQKLFGRKTTDSLLDDYSCALSREILIQGRIYITVNAIYFYAKILGWETAFKIKMGRIISITKEKTALFIPNAIQIKTRNEKFFFASFTSRDKVFLLLFRLWQDYLLTHTIKNKRFNESGSNTSSVIKFNLKEKNDNVIPEIKNVKIKRAVTSLSIAKKNYTNCKKSDREIQDNETLNVEHSVLNMSSILSHSGKINVNEKEICSEICSDHEHYKFMTLVNDTYDIPSDKLFALIFTDSYFYRKFSSDVERSQFNISRWHKRDDNLLRTMSYRMELFNTFGPKWCVSTHGQQLYIINPQNLSIRVDEVVINKDVPYSDCVQLIFRHCIRYISENKSNMIVTIYVKYSKSLFSVMRSLLENNIKTGLRHNFNVLKENLEMMIKFNTIEKNLEQYLHNEKIDKKYNIVLDRILNNCSEGDSPNESINESCSTKNALNDITSIRSSIKHARQASFYSEAGRTVATDITDIVLFKMGAVNVIEKITKFMGELEEQQSAYNDKVKSSSLLVKAKALPVKIFTKVIIYLINLILTLISVFKFTKNITFEFLSNFFRISHITFIKMFAVLFILYVIYSLFNLNNNLNPNTPHACSDGLCESDEWNDFNYRKKNIDKKLINLSSIKNIFNYLITSHPNPNPKLQLIKEEVIKTYDSINLLNLSLQRLFSLIDEPI
ncbi:GRAM domain-containing protein 2 [Intoshia linei]|uniref:GRAM domain-containing protein 2 n=1 Tax=Intoshia linei TaxID=1819745 RepID=A0A177B7I7_9BILA|nr:GRAM domain-containing protein 2 [Intoshia linei]